MSNVLRAMAKAGGVRKIGTGRYIHPDMDSFLMAGNARSRDHAGNPYRYARDGEASAEEGAEVTLNVTDEDVDQAKVRGCALGTLGRGASPRERCKRQGTILEQGPRPLAHVSQKRLRLSRCSRRQSPPAGSTIPLVEPSQRRSPPNCVASPDDGDTRDR